MLYSSLLPTLLSDQNTIENGRSDAEVQNYLAKLSYDAAQAAQQATLERDNAVDTLDDEWMSDFTAIAPMAFADKPQLLEKLGIKEPSNEQNLRILLFMKL